jgi:formiminoglutamase
LILRDDPDFPRASAWLAGEYTPKVRPGLHVLGAPVTRGSAIATRCDLGPASIRQALDRYSTYDIAEQRDLRHLAVHDAGDLDLAAMSPQEAFASINAAVGAGLHDAKAVALLGGDNSITYPAVLGMGVPPERCGVVTFDAHLNLRGLDNGLNNANPISALLRDGVPGDHIFLIGLQRFANSEAYHEVARQAGIHVISADHVRDRGVSEGVNRALSHLHQHADRIYVNLDVDVLDRIYAPATAGARPGGLSPYQIRRAAHLCGIHPKVRVFDLVEIDPTRDVSDVTSLTAAVCLLEFACGVLSRQVHL